MEGEVTVRVRRLQVVVQTQARRAAQYQHHHPLEAAAVPMSVGQFELSRQEVVEGSGGCFQVV